MKSKRTMLLVAHAGRPPAVRIARLVVNRLTAAGVARSKVLGVGLVGHGPQDRVGGTLLPPQFAPVESQRRHS